MHNPDKAEIRQIRQVRKWTGRLFPIAFLLTVFITGMTVKQIEDKRIAESFNQTIKDQRVSLLATCDSRVAQQADLQLQRMNERDARLADQLEMIREQRDMIIDLRKEVQRIAVQQNKVLAVHKSEITEMKQTKVAAQTAAKGVSNADKAAINNAVKKEAK